MKFRKGKQKETKELSRRDFIKLTGTGAACLGFYGLGLDLGVANADERPGGYPSPSSYIPDWPKFESYKRPLDDPRPYLTNYGPKQALPKSFYDQLTFDQAKMKSLWADLVGFKAPDVVGKLHPEIKPGKYTYKDLEKYPGFKDLMIPQLYASIKPGGPPFVGSIPEFEIIPTRQYYWAQPIAEATKANRGKSQQDAQGYLKQDTWLGGLPFPTPSGPHKAQQIMYNLQKSYCNWNWNSYFVSALPGYTNSLYKDFDGRLHVMHMNTAGRELMAPYGWSDKAAKAQGEYGVALICFDAPRDQAGQVIQQTIYVSDDKPDQLLVYIPSMRRIRMLSGTDTQDAIGGQDVIYDDSGGWSQKMSPNRYPYKYEVIDEREYLVRAPSIDGADYVSSKGLAFGNVRLERRPLWVLKLTQQDPNYVYGHRIVYMDKESLYLVYMENYDQKGRLYRTWDNGTGWHPDQGMLSWWGGITLAIDHIQGHSTYEQGFSLPAVYTRSELDIQSVATFR